MSDVRVRSRQRAFEMQQQELTIFCLKGRRIRQTMLARTLPSILPRLTFDEALEVTRLYSISGLLNGERL